MSDEYPILGEPLVVEFINTDYRDPDGSVDFLATPDLANGWMAAVAPEQVSPPAALSTRDVVALIALRSAIRAGLSGDSILSANQVEVLNDAARLRPVIRLLATTESGRPVLREPRKIDSVDGLMSQLADDTIGLLTGTTPGTVQVCNRPDCHMRYLQQHHRRRYCNTRCANAHRQARYNQRRTSTHPSTT